MLVALLLSLFTLADLGTSVGETIPEPERFEQLMGDDGATIVFVRSVSWCPYCRKQVKELDEARASFDQAGRPLVFVSYDDTELQRSFARLQGIQSAFVSDQGSELIKAFGILNENHRPDSRVYGIPHPAVFIVDRDGVVNAKLFEQDWATNEKSYRKRPAVETILAAVEG